MKRGFTLIEIIAVIAILGVLSAIVYPVYVRSKDSAHQTNCISNLRSIFQSVEIYRNDNDGGIAGSASSMGLPPRILEPYSSLKCNANLHQDSFPYKQLWQGFVIPSESDPWSKFVGTNGSNTPMLLDINYNDKNIPEFSPYFKRFGIVAYLDGSMKKLWRAGDADALATWKK